MESMKFEEALARLEALVERMESGELDLEASIAAFEEGIRLSLFCQQELQKAEGRMQRLMEGLNGELVLEDMEDIL
ncbi:MAG TPA: exodeoxyribonuclease VII small subunit [Syntrophomonadaceae bacterium]|nr:exodeoxyribonuclease VII small subunit [Syntrophomonadaceae bacterium]